MYIVELANMGIELHSIVTIGSDDYCLGEGSVLCCRKAVDADIDF